ncbi:MAG: class I SAM-dependent methyltransferase [Actinomycetota bacterium]
MSQDPKAADASVLDRAYGDSAKLRGRIDLYQWQRPRYDLHEIVPEFADYTDGDRVLDVGCGPGEALARLAARQPTSTLVGLDRSVGMLAEARRREGGARWAAGDVGALPVADGAVDVVLAMHMLYHARDPAAAVAELRRVLRPGGTAVVSTLGPTHLDGLREIVDDALAPSGLRWARNRERFDPGSLFAAFADVERHELNAEVVVDDVAPVVDYVETTRDFYDPAGGWEPVIASVGEVVRSRLDREGTFRIVTAVDVYVCR